MIVRFSRDGHRATHTTTAQAVEVVSEDGEIRDPTDNRIIAYVLHNKHRDFFRLPQSAVWYDRISILPEESNGVH